MPEWAAESFIAGLLLVLWEVLHALCFWICILCVSIALWFLASFLFCFAVSLEVGQFRKVVEPYVQYMEAC